MKNMKTRNNNEGFITAFNSIIKEKSFQGQLDNIDLTIHATL